MLTDKKLIAGINYPQKLIGGINFLDEEKSHVGAKVDSFIPCKVYGNKNYQLSGNTQKVDSDLTAKLTHCPKCNSRVNVAWKKCPDCYAALQGDGWTQDDWQEYFDERAGIYEYDGKMSRPDAERQAFDACISHWMNKNPPAHTDINTCPQCNGAINVQLNNSTAILTSNGGHIWLHDKCWAGWLERRKAEAISVLREMSIYANAVTDASDTTYTS